MLGPDEAPHVVRRRIKEHKEAQRTAGIMSRTRYGGQPSGKGNKYFAFLAALGLLSLPLLADVANDGGTEDSHDAILGTDCTEDIWKSPEPSESAGHHDNHTPYEHEELAKKPIKVEPEKDKENLRVIVAPIKTKDVPIPEEKGQEWVHRLTLSEKGGHDGRDVPNSIRNYLDQNSYGKIATNGIVLPWIELAKRRAEYEDIAELINETLHMLEKRLNLCNYDGDRNGYIDAILLLTPPHMVSDFKPQPRVSEWNNHFVNFGHLDIGPDFEQKRGGPIELLDYKLGGMKVFDGMIQELPAPDDGEFKDVWFGYLLHEFGHTLPLGFWGKPFAPKTWQDFYNQREFMQDLYFYNWKEGNEFHWIGSQHAKHALGPYELMAHGQHNLVEEGDQRFSAPSHFSAFMKYRLGWLQPQVVKQGERADIRLHRTEETEFTPEVKLVKIETPDPDHFYLLEWRRAEPLARGHNFDEGVPHSGLLIYNVTAKIRQMWTERSEIVLIDATPGEYDSNNAPGGALSVSRVPGYTGGLWHRPAFGPGTRMDYETPDGIDIELRGIAPDNEWAEVGVAYL